MCSSRVYRNSSDSLQTNQNNGEVKRCDNNPIGTANWYERITASRIDIVSSASTYLQRARAYDERTIQRQSAFTLLFRWDQYPISDAQRSAYLMKSLMSATFNFLQNLFSFHFTPILHPYTDCPWLVIVTHKLTQTPPPTEKFDFLTQFLFMFCNGNDEAVRVNIERSHMTRHTAYARWKQMNYANDSST